MKLDDKDEFESIFIEVVKHFYTLIHALLVDQRPAFFIWRGSEVAGYAKFKNGR